MVAPRDSGNTAHGRSDAGPGHCDQCQAAGRRCGSGAQVAPCGPAAGPPQQPAANSGDGHLRNGPEPDTANIRHVLQLAA
jgi:hypothetical protein